MQVVVMHTAVLRGAAHGRPRRAPEAGCRVHPAPVSDPAAMPFAAQPPWSQGRKAALALGAGICLTLCLLASLWAQKLDRWDEGNAGGKIRQNKVCARSVAPMLARLSMLQAPPTAAVVNGWRTGRTVAPVHTASLKLQLWRERARRQALVSSSAFPASPPFCACKICEEPGVCLVPKEKVSNGCTLARRP